jgi:CMP-N,N'-diacetyllegionaminic acid synthase
MNKSSKKELMALIPARSGSKSIREKNIRIFEGKPLIAHTIEQALTCPIIDRVIVDTDSRNIAKIALRYGAEVPFLRPHRFAKATSQIVHSVEYLLKTFEEKEKYKPTHIILLQATSPLREKIDIERCWYMMMKTSCDSVVSITETHPRLYNINHKLKLTLANGKKIQSTNRQAWNKGYKVNGFVWLVTTKALLREHSLMTKNIRGLVCPAWRSLDLDSPEDWILAKIIYKNKKHIEKSLKNFNK